MLTNLFGVEFYVATGIKVQEKIKKVLVLCSHPQQNVKLGTFTYSLTSPYRHLNNTDTSLLRTVRLVPEKPEIIHSLPL